MKTCRHDHLTLIPAEKQRLRCRHCHLTLTAEELVDGGCPECFERTGRIQDDFEPVRTERPAPTRYRCETCGVIIPYEVSRR